MGVSNGSVMFQCECDEPEGKVVRTVYALEFTPENLEKMWEKAKQFKTLMGREIHSYDDFLSFFVYPSADGYRSRGIAARIDDFVGIFWMTDFNLTHPPHEASIHYTFFDRRHKGRLQLCRKAIEYAFSTYGFHRLWTMVPAFVQPTQAMLANREKGKNNLYAERFVELIGFRKEGRMKEKVMFRGKLFDASLYALTRNEVINDNSLNKDNG